MDACWSWIWGPFYTCPRSSRPNFHFRDDIQEQTAWYPYQHLAQLLFVQLWRPLFRCWAKDLTEFSKRWGCHWPSLRRHHGEERPQPHSSVNRNICASQGRERRCCYAAHNVRVVHYVICECLWTGFSLWPPTCRRTRGTWPHCGGSTSYAGGSQCSTQLRFAWKIQ